MYFTLRSSSCSSSCRWRSVSILSFEFPALAFSVRTMFVLVASWLWIRYRIPSSVCHAFALQKSIPKHFHYLGLLLLPILRSLSNWTVRRIVVATLAVVVLFRLSCFARHLLLVACLRLYMEANDCSNLLCNPLFFLEVLQWVAWLSISLFWRCCCLGFSYSGRWTVCL